MYVFLILSSLGVAFYVVLLVALYRDGRERRQLNAGSVRTSESRHGRREVDSHGATGTASLAARRGQFAGRRALGPSNHALLEACHREPPAAIRRSACTLQRPLAAKTTCSAVKELGEEKLMRDIVLITVSVAFFLLSIGYVKFCDRVK